jgi:hypothetical protein
LGSPTFVGYEGEQILTALKTRAVGQDDVTDIVAINLKSGDYRGHYLGPESGECGETLAAINAQLEAIHKYLKKVAGKRLATVITADHGVAPSPTLSKATVIEDKKLAADINREFGAGVVLRIGSSSAQLDLGKAKNKVTLKNLRDYLFRYKVGEETFFQNVVTEDELKE